MALRRNEYWWIEGEDGNLIQPDGGYPLRLYMSENEVHAVINYYTNIFPPGKFRPVKVRLVKVEEE